MFSLRYEKECALAHSRAEARLPRQPSTLAPSAHPRGAFLSYGNEVSYTIRKPGAKFPVKHRAFLYVILSESPKKTSTEFYINP